MIVPFSQAALFVTISNMDFLWFHWERGWFIVILPRSPPDTKQVVSKWTEASVLETRKSNDCATSGQRWLPPLPMLLTSYRPLPFPKS